MGAEPTSLTRCLCSSIVEHLPEEQGVVGAVPTGDTMWSSGEDGESRQSVKLFPSG